MYRPHRGKFFLQENHMNTEETKLYSRFKETNWWAKHPNLYLYVSALYATCLLTWMTTPSFEMTVQEMGTGARAIPMVSFMVWTVLLFVFVLLKYFTHDRPLNRYIQENKQGDDTWTSDCGGILKIYD